MLFHTLVAACAAISAVAAQDVTSSATRCTTRFGYYALPTGTAGTEAVPTWYRYSTTTNLFSITYTTRDTVTSTPDATTFTDMLTTTTTIITTTTSIPEPIVVATPAGFIALSAAGSAVPTSNSRARRSIEGRDGHAVSLFKRQTAANNTGGFIVDRNGNVSSLDRKFIQRVDCRVSVTVNSTMTTIVTGTPETVVVAPATATSVSTTTISTTETITQIAPQQTIYEACQPNNVSKYTDLTSPHQ
jgi:hypothetical protein